VVSTSLWAVQDALVAMLRAERAVPGSPLEGKSISLGYPGVLDRDHIFVSGETDEARQSFGISSLAAKDETIALRIYVYTKLTTDRYEDVRAYVRAISDRIEALIGAQFTLGGAVMLAQVERLSLEESASGDQPATREQLLTLWVSCRAWLA
jgi:hypothetical protein